MTEDYSKLDKLMMEANWPKPSANLKSRIMGACLEDETSSVEVMPAFIKGYVASSWAKTAVFCSAVALCFMLGISTGNIGTSTSYDDSLYASSGTVLVAEMF